MLPNLVYLGLKTAFLHDQQLIGLSVGKTSSLEKLVLPGSGTAAEGSLVVNMANCKAGMHVDCQYGGTNVCLDGSNPYQSHFEFPQLE